MPGGRDAKPGTSLRWCAMVLAGLALLAGACSSGEQMLFERAEERWRAGSYDEAIRLHTLLYKRDMQGRYASRALLSIGNIQYQNLRQVQPAVEAYEKLILEFPGSDEVQAARLSLARIYENEMGDFTQAVEQYKRLLESDDLPNRQEIEYQLANAWFRMEDYHSALRELRRMEEAGISGHLAHKVLLRIGSLYQIENKYEDAASYFSRVADAACPECRRQAILSLAACHEAIFEFDKAGEVMGRLDDTPENRKLITEERLRLENKRRRVNSVTSLDFDRGHK